jgi:hypothetical protein
MGMETPTRRGQQAVDGAQEKGQEMLGQAQEKGQQAATQAKGKLREQVDQRSSQAAEQINQQASDLRSVSQSLRDQGKEGPAKAADRLAGYAEKAGSYLHEKDSDALLADVEDFGRRQPWAVGAGALMLGFAASRFLKASSSRRYASRYGGQPRSTEAPSLGHSPQTRISEAPLAPSDTPLPPEMPPPTGAVPPPVEVADSPLGAGSGEPAPRP